MSDSESEISNPNVFTFQNGNTTVSARGPSTNVNFSFRNPLTSTMCMPRNFERQRYAESVSDQRSIYYRRETSPMSIHSACDIRQRYQQYNGMSSQRSVFNGRSGSPMSMRSIDSSASVSAADIAFAFKNVKFNKYDLKVIKEAYHKLMKQRVRKRIEKRRNMKLFLKGSRNRSGDDSGEQGSDSSLSSDDCRSVKTSYKENMLSNRSARINLTDFRNTVRDSHMLKDCTDNLKQNSFKNMLSVSTSSFSRNHNFNNSLLSKPQNHYISNQKERFQNGFVLPSQRFNKSVASSVIPEKSEKHKNNIENNYRQNNRQPCNRNCESGSEEEIFSGIKEKSICITQSQHKRSLNSDDDTSLPDKKKSKLSSPTKNSQLNKRVPSKPKNTNPIDNNSKESTNNFEFAKPTLPVRKSKSKVQEKVIAKSKQPLTGFVEPIPNIIVNNLETAQISDSPEKTCVTQTSEQQADQTALSQSSDVSMRPSFIKRKLFTQKLDVAEKANLSTDAMNSPQNVYSAIQKEKNKARKLVTTQSCMNREVEEDNNLLDLIHKIVPPDRMNITNQTTINQTKTDADKSNKKDEDDDKWDVTSVISMYNENDVSDTFTDEEIFDDKKKDTKKNKKNSSANAKLKPKTVDTKTKNIFENGNLPRECSIVVEKIQTKKAVDPKNAAQNNTNKTVVKNSAKTFWDTDFESDAECQVAARKSYVIENQIKGNTVVEASKEEFKLPMGVSQSIVSKYQKPQQVQETSRWLNNTKNNTTLMNNTLDSSRKCNISTLSVRSHRTSKKKKCCNEICFQEITKSQNNIKTVTKLQNNGRNASKSEINPSITSNSESLNKVTSKSENNGKGKGSLKTMSKQENNTLNTSKSEVTNKNHTPKKKQANNQQNKKSIPTSNRKTENKNKTITKKSKPVSNENIQNINKSRSTSRTRKSPKETKSKTAKRNVRPKINLNNQSLLERPIRSCRTSSQNRSIENSGQFNISPLTVQRTLKKNEAHNDTSLQDVSSEIEINCKRQNRKLVTKTSPKIVRKNTSKETLNIKKSTIINIRQSPRNIKYYMNNKENCHTPRYDRPIRVCRTPKQNISKENDKSKVRGR